MDRPARGTLTCVRAAGPRLRFARGCLARYGLNLLVSDGATHRSCRACMTSADQRAPSASTPLSLSIPTSNLPSRSSSLALPASDTGKGEPGTVRAAMKPGCTPLRAPTCVVVVDRSGDRGVAGCRAAPHDRSPGRGRTALNWWRSADALRARRDQDRRHRHPDHGDQPAARDANRPVWCVLVAAAIGRAPRARTASLLTGRRKSKDRTRRATGRSRPLCRPRCHGGRSTLL